MLSPTNSGLLMLVGMVIIFIQYPL